MFTLVLGTGVAARAAACAPVDAGQKSFVLAARDRIGGRVYINPTFFDIPVEFGAECIHGDTAPTWTQVQALALHTLHWRKTDDSLVRLVAGSRRLMAECARPLSKRLYFVGEATATNDAAASEIWGLSGHYSLSSV